MGKYKYETVILKINLLILSIIVNKILKKQNTKIEEWV